MPLKTPAEYVESLRDGRVVFWDGDKIEDVTEGRRASACRSRSPRATTSTTTRSGAS